MISGDAVPILLCMLTTFANCCAGASRAVVVVLNCLFWCQSFDDVSPYVCSNHFSSIWVAE